MIQFIYHSTKKLALGARSYWNGLLSLPYPNNCSICSAEHSIEKSKLCLLCLSELPFTFYEKDLKTSRVAEVFFGRAKIKNVYAMLFFETGNYTQKLLHKLKYENDKELAKYLGTLIGKKLKAESLNDKIDYYIPVSLHSKKEFTRGYNQSEVLAEGISEILPAPILNNFVKKKKHNSSQTKKNRQDRIDNVTDLFYVSESSVLNGKHIVLVDDVLTTGATLESIANTLHQAVPQLQISIFTLAFAK